MSHPTPDQLAAFTEGALTGDERAEVVAHCAGCPECRELVGEVLDLAVTGPVKAHTFSECELSVACNAACTCGGKGPGDGCPACEVWRRLTGRAVPDPQRPASKDCCDELPGVNRDGEPTMYLCELSRGHRGPCDAPTVAHRLNRNRSAAPEPPPPADDPLHHATGESRR